MFKRRDPTDRAKAASIALMLVLDSHCCPNCTTYELLIAPRQQHQGNDVESVEGLSHSIRGKSRAN